MIPWIANALWQIHRLGRPRILDSQLSNRMIVRNILLIKISKTYVRKCSFDFERGRTSSWERGTPMIAHHHSYGNTHPELLPPLQPPRARSSFNKRSSEALSNYIYSLLGRKLPALPQCGKNWEIKINPHQRADSRALSLTSSAPFSDCALARNTSFSNLGGAGGHYRLRNLFLHSGGGGSLLAKLFSTRFARSLADRSR